MLKKTIIGFMLALFAGPLSAHAEMPGQACTTAQIGTTKMADDKQNIIACLETGKAAPENVQEWKAMTSSESGGGVTGGCYAWNYNNGGVSIEHWWGEGCKPINSSGRATANPGADHACSAAAKSGYECGAVYDTGTNNTIFRCLCIKKK